MTKTKRLTATEQRAAALCDSIRSGCTDHITIEWRKSKTWGSNPFIGWSGSNCCHVSGCGYCKESTALADVLQFLGNDENQSLNIAATGGCGVSSVAHALEAAGWSLTCVARSSTADTYRITRIDA
jgi:hypothetical protein